VVEWPAELRDAVSTRLAAVVSVASTGRVR